MVAVLPMKILHANTTEICMSMAVRITIWKQQGKSTITGVFETLSQLCKWGVTELWIKKQMQVLWLCISMTRKLRYFRTLWNTAHTVKQLRYVVWPEHNDIFLVNPTPSHPFMFSSFSLASFLGTVFIKTIYHELHKVEIVSVWWKESIGTNYISETLHFYFLNPKLWAFYHRTSMKKFKI